MKRLELTGQKFGLLTALRPSTTATTKDMQWVCKCDCGKILERPAKALNEASKTGYRSSCGCARYTHGMTKHPGYLCWQNMRNRCGDLTNLDYGGRGIKVCERWLVSFENFWADMGPTWVEGLTLDRRDNEAGYSPENCRWVTQKEQSNNQRLRYDHLPHDLARLARDTGRTYRSLHKRYYRGALDPEVLKQYVVGEQP